MCIKSFITIIIKKNNISRNLHEATAPIYMLDDRDFDFYLLRNLTIRIKFEPIVTANKKFRICKESIDCYVPHIFIKLYPRVSGSIL